MALYRNSLLFLAALGLLLSGARPALAQGAATVVAAPFADAIVLSRPVPWRGGAVFPDWLVDICHALRRVPAPRAVAAVTPPSASGVPAATPANRSGLRLSAAFGFSSPHLSSPYMAISTDLVGAEGKGRAIPVRLSDSAPYHLPDPFPQAGREVGVNIDYRFRQSYGLSGLDLTGRFALLAPDLTAPDRGHLGLVALKLEF
ncbi:MAG TPA: hypothetical protein VMI52_02500 [Acetobacteraceae bacterium]|nr:hypothetical protein [Acetobacteraceae bacterium]